MNCQSVLLKAACSAAFGVLFVPPLSAQGATRKVAINFQPMVGAEKFACGRSYAGVGTTAATITPSDFAVYVHDVKLLSASGAEVPVVLDQDGVFQNGTVALLDFEDGKGACSNGNAATHTALTGAVPEGKYSGVRFTIGVPFERNHLDLAAQPSPLSASRMFWAWNSGHKFARFDSKSAEGKSWVLHLGSAGCMPTGSAIKAPTGCAQENRVTVTIAGFDVDADAIVADAGSLFAGNGGPDNQVCMSSLKSPACAPMFAALGIPFNAPASKPQTFLRRASSAVSSRGLEK
ncbi:MAG: metallo-mystery pair system four-Cys motif protein [Phycisphaerae bacterium]|nr:metallo-mystery pair system four-Cys motif protein [Gemmatimonadaceae bacterium]